MDKIGPRTKRKLLRVALKIFADRGYAGTAVQAIVDAARVTKPTLYYYFGSKAGLYQALLDWANDERLRLMREAAGRDTSLPGQLVEVLAAIFDFIDGHRELMRLAFATPFSARGEVPREINYLKKASRNFEFFHGLIRRGRERGELSSRFSSLELARGLYGMMTIRVMAVLVLPERPPNRRDAESIVRLFLNGAAGPKR
jgi:AcrR family transcriptional regulator